MVPSAITLTKNICPSCEAKEVSEVHESLAPKVGIICSAAHVEMVKDGGSAADSDKDYLVVPETC